MERRVEIKLTLDEKLGVVAELIADYKGKKAVENILKNGGRYGCPFPKECNRFPCEDMWCNADVCSNGYAYRYS